MLWFYAQLHPCLLINVLKSKTCLTRPHGWCRPVQRDTAQQLETALAVAEGASEYLSQMTRVAADNAAAEIQAGDTLNDMMAGKHDLATGSAVEVLTQAIQAARRFPNLTVSHCHFHGERCVP